MKTRLRFPALLIAGGLGFVLGTLHERQPRIALAQAASAQEPSDGKLRIIVFGAHPDDAEYRAAGVAMKWAKQGHHVKLVATTNGDIGHWETAGGPLALRRKKEVAEVARRLGVVNEVLDNHDGELEPTLENRRAVTRLIKQWNADIVITNRPNDYHPDHRYTSVLVQDSAYMVTVPFITPDVPPLKKNPVFLYSSDRFQKPNPFKPDIAISIDDVIEPALDALLVMESQIHEGGANGYPGIYPADPIGRQKRRDEVRANLARRYASEADRYRELLVKFEGDKGRTAKYAQAYEICEYGRQPTQNELKQMFPF